MLCAIAASGVARGCVGETKIIRGQRGNQGTQRTTAAVSRFFERERVDGAVNTQSTELS